MSNEDPSADAGPWGSRTPGDPRRVGTPERPRDREPVFNAPWPALCLVAAILIAYALQAALAPGDEGVWSWGFAPVDLERGRWFGLLSAAMAHDSWVQALMFAVMALAFGAPVARTIGPGLGGAALFFLFYLACAVISALGYATAHLSSAETMLSASGAIAGLMGAAARLMGPAAKPIAPILSPTVYSFGIGWIVVSLLTALFSGPLLAGGRVAWEANIVGFIAGVLLIGPVVRLAHGEAGRADVT